MKKKPGIKSYKDGFRASIEVTHNIDGVQFETGMMGIVRGGKLEIWNPIDHRTHVIQLTPSRMMPYPYPAARMAYKAKEDRWGEIVPAGTGILEALVNARRTYIGVPLPGDTIVPSACDPGWRDSLAYLGVVTDPCWQVIFTKWTTLGQAEHYRRSLERQGFELRCGGNGAVIHLGLNKAALPHDAENSSFCGIQFSTVTKTYPILAIEPNIRAIYTEGRVCKRCKRAFPRELFW